MPGAVAGEGTCHLPSTFSTGFVWPFFGMVAMRTKRFSLAVAMISLLPSTGQFQKPLSGISMFDCPDANQTSPMSTRERTTFSPPCSSMTIVCSTFEAAGVAMLSSQRPSLSARVVNFSLVQSTETVMEDFGVASPQRRACVFC